MLDLQDLLESCLHEYRVVLHLIRKVPPGGMEYRPSATQRSTLEVLRYLAFAPLFAARAIARDDWAGWQAAVEASKALPAESAPAAIEAQMEALRELFAGLDPEALRAGEAHLPWGKVLPRSRALVEVPLKWLVGYRMQLFLQAKSAGNAELRTSDCWHGVERMR